MFMVMPKQKPFSQMKTGNRQAGYESPDFDDASPLLFFSEIFIKQ